MHDGAGRRLHLGGCFADCDSGDALRHDRGEVAAQNRRVFDFPM
jgi:hypothetical protein